MPLSTIGTGPVEQVLEERRLNASVAAQNFRAGFDVAQFATQARLSLRAQALQEQSLKLEQGRLNLATLDFQQRSQYFELQKEKWTMERKQIEQEIARSEMLLPLEKMKAAATLQAGQRQLEGQAEFEAFGSDALGAIQQNATQQKKAISSGNLSPEPDPGMLDLFRLYPNLMTHPEVMKAQDEANKDVAAFRERWMMTTGRAGVSGMLGGVAGQKLQLLQQYQSEIDDKVAMGALTPSQGESILKDVRQLLVSPTLITQVQNVRDDTFKMIQENLKNKLLLGADSAVGDKFLSYAKRRLAAAQDVDEANSVGADLFAEAASLTNVKPDSIPKHWTSGTTPIAPAGVPQGTTRTNTVDGVEVIFRRTP